MTDPFDAALHPHVRRTDALIRARFADARAHALHGDIATAGQRLADLQVALAGPGGSGAIGDARAAFYREAHRQHEFDPDLHDPDRRDPTPEGAAAARSISLFGADQGREVAGLLELARHGLVAAHAGTGSAADARLRDMIIDTWHEQHSTAVRAWARRTLSNSQVAIHAAVGWLMQKPEYRNEI